MTSQFTISRRFWCSCRKYCARAVALIIILALFYSLDNKSGGLPGRTSAVTDGSIKTPREGRDEVSKHNGIELKLLKEPVYQHEWIADDTGSDFRTGRAKVDEIHGESSGINIASSISKGQTLLAIRQKKDKEVLDGILCPGASETVSAVKKSVQGKTDCGYYGLKYSPTIQDYIAGVETFLSADGIELTFPTSNNKTLWEYERFSRDGLLESIVMEKVEGINQYFEELVRYMATYPDGGGGGKLWLGREAVARAIMLISPLGVCSELVEEMKLWLSNWTNVNRNSNAGSANQTQANNTTVTSSTVEPWTTAVMMASRAKELEILEEAVPVASTQVATTVRQAKKEETIETEEKNTRVARLDQEVKNAVQRLKIRQATLGKGLYFKSGENTDDFLTMYRHGLAAYYVVQTHAVTVTKENEVRDELIASIISALGMGDLQARLDSAVSAGVAEGRSSREIQGLRMTYVDTLLKAGHMLDTGNTKSSGQAMMALAKDIAVNNLGLAFADSKRENWRSCQRAG